MSKSRLIKSSLNSRNSMNQYQLINEIDKLLAENEGHMSEKKVCLIFNISPYQIPWGSKISWARCFQSNQTFDLIQTKKEN